MGNIGRYMLSTAAGAGMGAAVALARRSLRPTHAGRPARSLPTPDWTAPQEPRIPTPSSSPRDAAAAAEAIDAARVRLRARAEALRAERQEHPPEPA